MQETDSTALFDPSRHEALQVLDWNPDAVRDCIRRIVEDAEDHFDPDLFWPAHPRDRAKDSDSETGLTPLYYGACGAVWALHYLQGVGAIRLHAEYFPILDTVRAKNREWLGDIADEASASYMMGDTAFLLMQWERAIDPTGLENTLDQLISGHLEHPFRELMWGAPGSLLAALLLHTRSGHTRWADRFVQTAAKLWSQLLWSEEFQCHYWQQDLYGRECTYLDAVHGFVATAFVVIKGRHLLPPSAWQAWKQCIHQTITRTATGAGEHVNWRAQLLSGADEKPRFLMQYCHGAPGFVICLADMPDPTLDELLMRAGHTIWAAGPLTKGVNLCHGTGGNGYAFLKLYQRTGNPMWLERARAFAMHGIVQVTADRAQYGQGQYSLWTGDLGFAIFLWDCLSGQPKFPTLDVFFTPREISLQPSQ